MQLFAYQANKTLLEMSQTQPPGQNGSQIDETITLNLVCGEDIYGEWLVSISILLLTK
jgi:hypothetical protein